MKKKCRNILKENPTGEEDGEKGRRWYMGRDEGGQRAKLFINCLDAIH